MHTFNPGIWEAQAGERPWSVQQHVRKDRYPKHPFLYLFLITYRQIPNYKISPVFRDEFNLQLSLKLKRILLCYIPKKYA